MNQDLLKSGLASLERKLNLLIGEKKTLHNELVVLRNENADLKSLIKQKDEQIGSFQNKIKISKIVNEIDTEDGNASELKSKIDDYIKEIDKCIAHLSK